jgi:hypothetical protein
MLWQPPGRARRARGFESRPPGDGGKSSKSSWPLIRQLHEDRSGSNDQEEISVSVPVVLSIGIKVEPARSRKGWASDIAEGETFPFQRTTLITTTLSSYVERPCVAPPPSLPLFEPPRE